MNENYRIFNHNNNIIVIKKESIKKKMLGDCYQNRCKIKYNLKINDDIRQIVEAVDYKEKESLIIENDNLSLSIKTIVEIRGRKKKDFLKIIPAPVYAEDGLALECIKEGGKEIWFEYFKNNPVYCKIRIY